MVWICDKCGQVVPDDKLCSVETESGELFVFDRTCQLKYIGGDTTVISQKQLTRLYKQHGE